MMRLISGGELVVSGNFGDGRLSVK